MAEPTSWNELERVVRDPDATPLDVLRVVGTWRRLLDAVEEAAVKAARRTGATWEEIGDATGVTRQSAWQRLRHLEESIQKASDVDARARFVDDVLWLMNRPYGDR